MIGNPPWLARFVAPGLWIFFWFWTALVAFVWLSGTGEAEVSAWLRGSGAEVAGAVLPLEAQAHIFLRLLDPVWLALAAATAYISLARSAGLARARIWAAGIFVAAMVTGWALQIQVTIEDGEQRLQPVPSLHFTTRLGPRLAQVPAGLAMLWLAVVIGGREAIRRLRPRGRHAEVALGTGVLAALTAWNLELAATHDRVWWFWERGSAPWFYYAIWLAGGAGLVWIFRPDGGPGRRERWRGALVLGALNLLAACSRLHAAFHH